MLSHAKRRWKYLLIQFNSFNQSILARLWLWYIQFQSKEISIRSFLDLRSFSIDVFNTGFPDTGFSLRVIFETRLVGLNRYPWMEMSAAPIESCYLFWRDVDKGTKEDYFFARGILQRRKLSVNGIDDRSITGWIMIFSRQVHVLFARINARESQRISVVERTENRRNAPNSWIAQCGCRAIVNPQPTMY